MKNLTEAPLLLLTAGAIIAGSAISPLWTYNPVSPVMVALALIFGLLFRPLMPGAFFLIGIMLGQRGGYMQPADYLSNAASPLRQMFHGSIDRNMPGEEAAAIARAVYLGERSNTALEKKLDQAGLGHLMAVSGFHVGIVSGVVHRIAISAGGRLNAPLAAGTAAVMMACITGMRASVIRAASVMICAALAYHLKRHGRGVYRAAFAVIICCLLAPSRVGSIGMMLSLAGFIGISEGWAAVGGFIRRNFPDIPGVAADLLAVTVSVQATVTPLLLKFFGSVPLCSFPANLLLLPMASVVLTTGLAALILPAWAGAAGGSLFFTMISLMADMAGWIYRIIPGKLEFEPSWTAIILYYCALAGLISGKIRRFAVLSAICLIMISVQNAYMRPVTYSACSDSMNYGIIMLDVGNGDCLLLRAGTTSLMVDCPAWGTGLALAEMGRQGVKQLQGAIITHPHRDHQDGILDLVKLGKVKKLIIPGARNMDRAAGIAETHGIPLITMNLGDRLQLGEISLKALWPPPGFVTDDDNDISLVLTAAYGGRRVLLTGDESRWVSEWSGRIRSPVDIVKLPHHGDYFHGKDSFFHRTSPAKALIPVGRHNSYGHPSSRLIEQVINRNIKLYRSDRDGDVRIRF